jgi:serine-type D-Ala-D-Ala carboxypeptidase
MEQGVRDGVFSGAVVWVRHLDVDEPGSGVCVGTVSADPPGPALTEATLFDLASLTKLYTGAAALRLVAAGLLDLDEDVAPRLAAPHLSGVTARLLLSHRSGLPAWKPLFGGFDVVGRALREPLEAAPGSRHLYSDIGFLVLGALLSRVSGLSVADVVRREVLEPLGLDGTDYRPVGAGDAAARALLATGAVAATELCENRGLVCGEVMDRNTWAMGGAAPHAGLFGTAAQVAAFAAGWWNAIPTGWLPQALVDAAWTHPSPGTHGLAWDSVAPAGYSSAGRVLSPHSRGHLGFSGTSLWIDPEREVAIVLLTNRTHPDRNNPRLKPFRPLLHDDVARAIDAGRD